MPAKSQKPKQKRRAKKYDWVKLKAEFLSGDWLTAKDFLRDKKMPLANQKNTKGWTEDKKKYQEQVLIESSKEMMKDDTFDIVKVRQRQARLARFMQLKGMQTIKTEEVKDVDTARKLVVAGLKEERHAVGMEQKGGTSLTQINIGGKTNLDKLVDKLDYEGILELIAELKRERARRALQPSNESSDAEVEDGEII